MDSEWRVREGGICMCRSDERVVMVRHACVCGRVREGMLKGCRQGSVNKLCYYCGRGAGPVHNSTGSAQADGAGVPLAWRRTPPTGAALGKRAQPPGACKHGAITAPPAAEGRAGRCGVRGEVDWAPAASAAHPVRP